MIRSLFVAALAVALAGCAGDPQVVYVAAPEVEVRPPPECLARDAVFPKLPDTPDGIDTETAVRDRLALESRDATAVYRRAVCRRWLEAQFALKNETRVAKQ
jgi:hypothetical protein